MLKMARRGFFLFCFVFFLCLFSCGEEVLQESPSISRKTDGVKENSAEKRFSETSQRENVQGKKVSSEVPAVEKAKADPPPRYDPKGRVDPFFPVVESAPRAGKKERVISAERRAPETPLEEIDLGQLRLVGIIHSPLGRSAVVEESSGRGYVVTSGTYMGIHSGRVTAIDMDRIIVTEIVTDRVGEAREERRELKLQKSVGE